MLASAPWGSQESVETNECSPLQQRQRSTRIMINNDVLRRLRYAFDLNDVAMISMFAAGSAIILREELLAWLKKETDQGFVELDDSRLDSVLDGLILARRGPQERAPGQLPPPKVTLTNNVILRKLKIAMNFKEDDMIRTLALADYKISRGELSALFRQKGHKNYRPCGDQVIRNFLTGLSISLRGKRG